MYVRFVVIMTLLGTAPLTAFGQEIDAELKERFLREAPEAWKEYAEFYSRLHVKATTNVTATWVLDMPKKLEFEYKFGDAGALRRDTWGVQGTNRSYSFSLGRDPDKGWVLHHVRFHEDQDKAEEARERLRQQHGFPVCLQVFGRRLPDLVRDPDFEIKSIQPYNYDEEELVKLEFVNHKPQRPNEALFRDGWMILDPHHAWIIREYEFNGNIRITYYIREDENKNPIVERSTHLSVGRLKGRLVEEAVCDTTYEPSIPESEFMLTAFGLPEPDPSDQERLAPPQVVPNQPLPRRQPPVAGKQHEAASSSNSSLWIFLAAAGVLVLAVIARQAGRRWQAKP